MFRCAIKTSESVQLCTRWIGSERLLYRLYYYVQKRLRALGQFGCDVHGQISWWVDGQVDGRVNGPPTAQREDGLMGTVDGLQFSQV